MTQTTETVSSPFTKMSPNDEIRKLGPASLFGLVQILETSQSWKKLIGIIPYDLESNSIRMKYNSEHVNMLERFSKTHGREPSAVLLEEWGISGRSRPQIRHLYDLLIQAELYRAADFVAINILQVPIPERPKCGPAAKIDVPDPIETPLLSKERNEIKDLLNNASYPQSLSHINSKSINVNERKSENILSIPKININLSSDSNNSSHIKSSPSTNISELTSDEPLNSNLIQFSTSYNLPHISELIDRKNNSVSVSQNSIISTSENIPNVALLLNQTSQSSDISSQISQSSNFTENYSRDENQESSIQSENYLPNLSIINPHSDEVSQEYLPDISLLNVQSNDENVSHGLSENSIFLPNFSLDTALPQYTYHELKVATNNFEDAPYDVINLHTGVNGRKLGVGAFGTVYLALNLSDKPVAVKKLQMNEALTDRNDYTKRFKNEVEILSRYSHENLVSLLGYSYDGPNYCLVYEYVSGGSLLERLKQKSNSLSWKSRLKIALGTANGISYLHNAYETPLIHRDVKTANILLDTNCVPKLCDFGLIKLAATPNVNSSTTTAVIGTSAYMAPEAFRRDLSIKIDSFSFGVVLLELLTSLPPFDEQREGADLVTHVEEICEDGIDPLLDTTIGDWQCNDVNFGSDLFKIANLCLEEKKRRPIMSDVYNDLLALTAKIT